MSRICKYHLCKNEVTGKRRTYCSDPCNTKDAVNRWRRRLKQKAIEYLGGKCKSCNYSKCAAVLEFHHKDPTKKDFGIGASGHCRSWESVKVELDKCDLLCANCHREQHFIWDNAPGAGIEPAMGITPLV